MKGWDLKIETFTWKMESEFLKGNFMFIKIEKETKDAIKLILCASMVALMLSFLSGCGRTGPVGPQGGQGIQGEVGATGETGAAGAPGQNCTVQTLGVTSETPNGGSLISCPDGSQSLVLNGTNGTNGTDGTNGTNGTNGTDGTIITPVQFCPSSFVPNYPNTFPEVGFCINNQLYGVYSENDGFMTLLTPGEYESDGINASCTFTIEADCVVDN